MAKKKSKNIREKGKIRLSEYFKEIKEGQKVAIIQEKTVHGSHPKRIVGSVGVVVGERGDYKVVGLMDGDKKKTFVIHPIHLKVLK